MKVRYDNKTGRLGKAYPETMQVPDPYIILTTDEIDNILGNENDYYFIYIDDNHHISQSGTKYKAYAGADLIFFTEDDYYIVPTYIDIVTDNTIAKEILSMIKEREMK